jgi:peptide/nickel transport system permease protein
MQGIGVRPAVGFWQDAWGSVLKRPTSVLAVSWLGLIAFMAVFAGVLASGHPLWIVSKGADGTLSGSSPLLANLPALDLVLIIGVLAGTAWTFFGPGPSRGKRAAGALGGLILAVAIVATGQIVQNYLTDLASEADARARTVLQRTGVAPEASTPFVRSEHAGLIVAISIAAVGLVIGLLLPYGKLATRIGIVLFACVLAGWAVQARFVKPLERFDYERRIEAGTITSATWTLVPWSPLQRDSGVQRKPPGTRYGEQTNRPDTAALASFHFRLGTDAFGQDVLSQLMHASRLAISIGLVSTSIALLIGVTLGALMGYFGGWVDTLGMRIVEIFMAVPVLFLLIVMAGVLPEEMRTAYVLMAIIGCFTWTGMARFTRAEFMKLRNQDFVQAAQATGLPLHSILFKHMLPNGVAPVLVDTSFAIAAAIGVEATLSYLNLGPTESASWGKLLQSAVSTEGEFKWWLAVFPGGAIFLTVLAYNLLGEALRDAIDPKLKKARV